MIEPTPGQNITIDPASFQINIINSDFENAFGAALLGLLAMILAFALMRAHRQNRKLLQQLQSTNSPMR